MTKYWFQFILFNLFSILVIVSIASCGPMPESSKSQNLEKTRSAIEQQLTQQVIQAQLTQPAILAATQNAEATQLAFQATDISQKATEAAMTTALVPETANVTPTTNINLQIRAAKILLYENMSGEKIFDIYHPRYVQAALDRGGYSYTNVGSALGWFKDSLLNQPEWDLIIASSEAHNRLSGEYFTYIFDHIRRGSAVIFELWDLDEMQGGTVAPILDLCGIAVYADWSNLKSLVMWPLVPDHPIFNYPNQGISLTSSTPFWPDDHGDLLKVTDSGDPQILAGTQQSQLLDHGTITTCLNGRMIIQSFRSHDFSRYDMENLWENYINFVLRSKFTSQ